MATANTTKISISGAFCSGKTTLLRGLRDRIPGAIVVDEIATISRELIPELDWRNTDVRGYLFWAQACAEREAEIRGGLTLFDGSLIDVLAYSGVFGVAEPASWRGINLLPYDLTFLCSTEGIDIEPNGIRETDALLRQRAHSAMLKEAPLLSHRVVALVGDDQHRVETALDILRSIGSAR